jgi:hypothetical protein
MNEILFKVFSVTLGDLQLYLAYYFIVFFTCASSAIQSFRLGRRQMGIILAFLSIRFFLATLRIAVVYPSEAIGIVDIFTGIACVALSIRALKQRGTESNQDLFSGDTRKHV